MCLLVFLMAYDLSPFCSVTGCLCLFCIRRYVSDCFPVPSCSVAHSFIFFLLPPLLFIFCCCFLLVFLVISFLNLLQHFAFSLGVTNSIIRGILSTKAGMSVQLMCRCLLQRKVFEHKAEKQRRLFLHSLKNITRRTSLTERKTFCTLTKKIQSDFVTCTSVHQNFGKT